MLEMSEEEKESQLIEETEIEIQNLHEYTKIYQHECFFREKLIIKAVILKHTHSNCSQRNSLLGKMLLQMYSR